ncbi:hypothetical protein [Cyanobium sp. LEGE 06113]|uniref:hypothetical protein n=1 Tax=Cyanobium sp. LEGE 06113 TaxID=1297573 RepID=UPI00351C5C4D
MSGLSPSPLLNSLLPALGTLPALLPLRRRAWAYALQLLAVLALLAVAAAQALQWLPAPLLLAASLLAVLLFALGAELSGLPLQRRLLRQPGSSIEQLRRGSDLGSLVGYLLTALLFPAALQFGPALLLLLPLGLLLAVRGRGTGPAVAEGELPKAPAQTIPFSRLCALQGLLFGGLFALLPLWVRAVGEGDCFDFAMLLAAYGLGRGFTGLLPPLNGPLRYGLMAVLLGTAQLVPGWSAVLLFLPLGGLAAASDAALVGALGPLGDAPLRWTVLQRSGAVGGLAGSLGMGLLSQLLGLGLALPLQLLAFAALAWPLGRCR